MDTELDYAVPWMQAADEPDEWYDKFITFYVPLGPTRTLSRAFEKFATANATVEQMVLLTTKRIIIAPNSWAKASGEYNWRKRAISYDAEQVKGIASTISQARQELQEATLDAVQALKKALNNPKTAVVAAKEILDRGGLPSVQVHAIKTIPFTADDLAQARDEVNEWLKQQQLPQVLQLKSSQE